MSFEAYAGVHHRFNRASSVIEFFFRFRGLGSEVGRSLEDFDVLPERPRGVSAARKSPCTRHASCLLFSNSTSTTPRVGSINGHLVIQVSYCSYRCALSSSLSFRMFSTSVYVRSMSINSLHNRVLKRCLSRKVNPVR